MARTVLGVVGAAVGGYFGGASGAQWGYLIGSTIGGIIDPQVIGQQGPRMNDLKIQVSSLGVPIPIYYGDMRGAGNVIWSTAIRETAATEEDDGKGGPVVETTTYSYSVDMAVGIGEGEIAGIRKIWANGRLIYDISADATIETIAASQQFAAGFKVYTGSQTQMPDPTMEAEKGAGNVSAYRGLAYVVFDNMQLADYGNQAPNFEFEVVESGVPSFVNRGTLSALHYVHPSHPSIDNSSSCVPYMDGESVWLYQGQWDADLDVGPAAVKLSRLLLDGTAIDHGILPVVGVDLFDTPSMARLNSDINVCAVMAGNELHFVGPDTGAMFTLPSSRNFGQEKVVKRDRHVVVAGGHGNDINVWDFISGFWNSDNPPAASIQGISLKFNGGVDIIGDTLYAAVWIGGTVWIERYNLAASGSTPTIAFVSSFDTGLAIASTVVANGICFVAAGDDAFYLVDENYIYLVASTGNTNLGARPDVWDVGGGPDMQVDRGVFYISRGFVGTPKRDVTYVASTSLSSTPTVLSTIVADQCDRSGLSASDIDVTALTDIVTGYAVTRQGAARANINQLQKAFYFDAAESDGKLKFVKRGGSVAVTIAYDDLAAHEPGQQAPVPLDIRRIQEVDLPAKISVNFYNADADYQLGNENATRLVTLSKQNVTVDLAIAMKPDKAAQIADVLMYEAHVARTPFKFQTTKKYAKYQPTDVIAVEVPNGSYRMRSTNKSESGPLINWEAAADDATIYTSTAVGGTVGQTQTQITTPGPTNVEFMDIPMIRDQDDDAGLYVAMGGYRSAWHGAALFRSSDDTAYANVASVLNTATIGTCDTMLGNWTGGNIFDEAHSLDVTLASGTLSSYTVDQVLNGSGAALVGSEIIQFKTATLIGTSQYRLTGLLRGRRGTEQHIGTHAASERFVSLTLAGTVRPNEGAAAIGLLRYYQGVSIGQSRSQAQKETFTNDGAGLKPYSPVNFSGGKQSNGDYIIGWTRRTRIDGGWRDLIDVPLAETTESYEVDIMSGSTVKRTITSTTATVTYTSAQQVTDFGGVQSALTVNVYQMSATVGRGFPGTKTY